jgi:hypothetical protein
VIAVPVLGVLVGVFLIVSTSTSVMRQLIIPRARMGPIGRAVDQVVDVAFQLVTRRVRVYARRDSILAAQAATFLLVQLMVWLAAYLVAFALLIWPTTHHLGVAFRESGSSMFTLGFVAPAGARTTALDILAAAFGLVVIAAQIGYIPTLYGAFNRRETEVTLLDSRAGSPPWGPELLARTKYGIYGGRDDLTAFYASWERWSADLAESHSNYPVLMRFRSPQPQTSWLIGLLAVMDSAALLLSLSPSRDRLEPRLCLRMGFVALRQMGGAVGLPVDTDPDPDADLALSYEDFEAGVRRMLDVGFEIERTPEEAWPHFRGWRVNYEATAYALAYRLDAVPTLWSGPRRFAADAMAPNRPANRLPGASRAPDKPNKPNKPDQEMR